MKISEIKKLNKSILTTKEKVFHGRLLIQEATIKYGLLLSMVILAITAKSQTNPNRGQNELNVIEFHALTDPSCTALGMDDNQEKLTTHAMLTQDYLGATDTRLIDMALFCRVDQETTTDIIGTGNESSDMLSFKDWLWDPSNGASINDIQYFYTNYSPPGYEESSYNGEDQNGFCRALFNGAYDSDTYGAHAFGHVSGAVGGAHDEARYDATYTTDLTAIGGNIFDSYDGESIGGMDNYPGGNTYLPFYCTPESYNKDTPANGGDGYYYFNSIWDNDPSWIATDQMNNNTGYTETTTGIYNFLVANPEKVQEEAVAPPDTPVAVQTGDNSIGTSTTYDVEYPNTTSSAYQGVYFTNEIASIYLYDANNSGDGQFLYGPKNPDEDFDNLPAGTYVIRTYFHWSNGISSVSNTITVTGPDTEDPNAVCQSATVQLGTNGQAIITPDMVDGGSTDNVGIVSYTVTPNTVDCDDIGNISVMLTVEDAAGNTSSCNATVTVEDLLGPTANAQTTTAYLDVNGNVVIDPNDVNDNSTDNCSIVSMSVNPANFTCTNIGANSVALTVTDGSGNSHTTNFNVNIEDNMAPEAIGQNLTLNLDGNSSVTTTAEAVDNGSSDNCEITDMTLSQYTFTEEGVFDIDFTVIDGEENSTTITVQITVVDSEDINPPTAICQNAGVNLDANGEATITTDMIDNGSWDEEGDVTLSVNPTNVDCSDLGNITVTLTVTDGGGNTDQCTSTLSVNDITTPNMQAQNITIDLAETAPSPYIIYPEDVDNGSSDNCSFTMQVSPNSFEHTGVYDVTLSGEDESGNTSETSLQLTAIRSVGIPEAENAAGIHIYPNPTSGMVRIETNQPIEQIRIYNLIGQLVYENKPQPDKNKKQIKIQTANWTAGIYTVNTRTTAGFQKTIKLIVR
jgi:hypothetical protein